MFLHLQGLLISKLSDFHEIFYMKVGIPDTHSVLHKKF
jgi:hypothetical protein